MIKCLRERKRWVPKIFLFFYLALFCGLTSKGWASEFKLINGDQITGEVIKETEDVLFIETKAIGTVALKKEFLVPEKIVKELESLKETREKVSVWQKKISLGYNVVSGNTEERQISGRFEISKETEADQWNARLNSYVASANTKENARKFNGFIRHGFNLGDHNQWNIFTKLEGDQDRFANIDYRVIPSFGAGYWFVKEADFKVTLDAALGYEYTKYRDGSPTDKEMIVVPHGYFEKKLFENIRISQNLTLYPSLKDTTKYRFHSETALENLISKNVSFKVSFIDDYNSVPKGTSKKNDTRLISSINYSF